MATDNLDVSLSPNECVHLAMGLGILIEYLTGHAKVATKCPNAQSLMKNIETLAIEYHLDDDDLVALMDKLQPKTIPSVLIPRKANVSILPS